MTSNARPASKREQTISVPPKRATVTVAPEPNDDAIGTMKKVRIGVVAAWRAARIEPRPPAIASCEYTIIFGAASDPEETRMRAGAAASTASRPASGGPELTSSSRLSGLLDPDTITVRNEGDRKSVV